MKAISKRLWLALSIIVLLPYAAFSQSYGMVPSEDVYVDEEFPAVNFNGQNLFLDVVNFGAVSVRKNCCLKFDIPAGVVASNSGILGFHLESPAVLCVFDSIRIWELHDAWSETTLTWNDLSGMSKTWIGTKINVTGSLTLDIPAAILNNWAANPGNNHGIMLEVYNTSPGFYALFTDKENFQISCSTLFLISNAPFVPNAPFLVGPDTICGTEGGYFRTFPTNFGNHAWSYPPGWIPFIVMQNMLEIFQADSSGLVCVSYSTTGGTSAPTCKYVFVDPPVPVPGTLSGPTVACAGDTVTYTLTPVGNYPLYIWEFPDDWVVISGEGSTQVTVLVGYDYGSIRVSLPETSCTLNPPALFNTYVQPLPDLPILSGPTTVLPNSLVTFTAFASYASQYQWSLPPGASILSGDSTYMVQIQFGIQAGNLCVKGLNPCGEGPSSCLAIGITGLEDLQADDLTEVWNDPVDPGILHIRNNAGSSISLQIWNTAGQAVSPAKIIVPGDEIRIRLDAGLFMVEIRSQQGRTLRKLSSW